MDIEFLFVKKFDSVESLMERQRQLCGLINTFNSRLWLGALPRTMRLNEVYWDAETLEFGTIFKPSRYPLVMHQEADTGSIKISDPCMYSVADFNEFDFGEAR